MQHKVAEEIPVIIDIIKSIEEEGSESEHEYILEEVVEKAEQIQHRMNQRLPEMTFIPEKPFIWISLDILDHVLVNDMARKKCFSVVWSVIHACHVIV